MYTATITTDHDGHGTTTHTYGETTTELMIASALRHGFTLTADPAAATLTLTGNSRTVTLAPAEPLAPLTPAQRRALLAIAADPRAPLRWEWSERNVPHLEHAGHPLNRQVSASLLDAGYVSEPGDGHGTALNMFTLRAWLAVARLYADPATAAALLRAVHTPAPATA